MMNESSVTENEKFVVEIGVSEIMGVTLPSHLCTLVVILIGKLFSNLSHTCLEETCVPNVCSVVNQRKVVIFLKEFIMIVTLLVFLTTILSGYLPFVIATMLIIITILIFTMYLFHHSVTNFSIYSVRNILNLPIHDSKRSFITCCRSIVNIMTVISILAVDFRIFPKKFSKTGKFGLSLMDVGVGFFILSNAAVLKLEKVMNQGFRQCLIGSLVLFIIGVLRCVFIQEINYGVNVSEYGVHWNFFFTLGTVRLFTFIILYVFYSHPSLSGIILCLVHQCFLSLGTENYVLGNKPRESFIDANREGIVSTLGYTSLYLIGVSLNKFIVKTSADVKGDLNSLGKVIATGSVLFTISLTLSPYLPPCRRVVNLTYITWVLAMATIHVAVAICVELFTICFVLPSTIKAKFYNFLTPVILEAVNMNGLLFFLLGNIFTGMVNILFDTKKLSGFHSVSILLAYMIANCAIATTMFFRNIIFKFW